MTCLAVHKVHPLGTSCITDCYVHPSVSSQTVTLASACCDIKHINSVSFYTQMQGNQRWEIGTKIGALTLFVPENI